jgi:hypothetical protein
VFSQLDRWFGVDATMTTVFRALLVVGVVGIAAGVPTAAAGDVLVASMSRPSRVSAFSGAVTWSQYDPVTRRYALVIRQAGRSVVAPVPSSAAPFDAQLGPVGTHSIAAVYSRCSTAPGSHVAGLAPFLQGRIVNPQTGRGCRLYRYVLGQAGEHRLKIRGLTGISAFLPSLWRSRLVFVGLQHAHHTWVSSIFTSRTPTGSTARRIASGPRGIGDLAPQVTGTALRGQDVAFGWDWASATYGQGVSTVYTTTVGSHTRHRIMQDTDGRTQFLAPLYHGSTLALPLVESRPQEPTAGISFIGRLPTFIATPAQLTSAAVDGSAAYYSLSTAAEVGQDCTPLSAAAPQLTCGIYLASQPAP